MCLVAKELGALLKVLRKDPLGNTFEALAVLGWDAVPLFGCSKVQIVDRVQVHVLLESIVSRVSFPCLLLTIILRLCFVSPCDAFTSTCHAKVAFHIPK